MKKQFNLLLFIILIMINQLGYSQGENVIEQAKENIINKLGPTWFDFLKSFLNEYIIKNNIENIKVKDLPDYAQSELQRVFDNNLLERVNIYFPIPLNSFKSKIGLINKINQIFGGVPPSAQTFGNNIYLENFDVRIFEDRQRLAHEIVHVYQYKKYGYEGFKNIYKQALLEGKTYEQVPLELEAYALQNDFGYSAADGRYKTSNLICNLGLILDSSGSMKENDPQDIRKSAVEMIINELKGNENVFLIDFDDHSTWLNPNNYEDYNKELLKNDIRSVNSSGGTDIGSGLSTLQSAIETTGKTNFKGGAILLTDGKNNSTFNYSLLDWYKQNNMPISTISFVGDVDNKLLSDIAAITNGYYFRANTANDVVMYFREFLNSINGNSTLTLFRNLIQQGEFQTLSYYVDDGMGVINVGANWRGSKIRLKLLSPQNKVYIENDNNGEWNIGSNYSSVKILNPEPGKWRAQFYGENILNGGEKYVFQVTGDSPNKIAIEDKLLDNGQMQFDLQNSGSEGIFNIKSKIAVSTPKDRKEDISNNFSNNGFSYRARDGQGNYNFEIRVTGKNNAGSTIQRYFARTILVGEGMPSYIAPVKMMEGSYVYANLGTDIGNFSGLECTIYSQNGNAPIATGYVTFVSETECTIEIQNFLSDQNVNIGDRIELNITQWQQDFYVR